MKFNLMDKLAKTYCVISHTHWDREWYLTQEQFRVRLIDLMDHVLQIIDNQPQYIFHLDAQTIILEDYLQIRPHTLEKIQKHVKSGNLIIGPWYVQNDFFLTSGESTIRNLLIGSRIANQMGACGKIGYIPDQFGNISQLPQIFNGFSIDNCMFGRGYQFHEQSDDGQTKLKPMTPEFFWECPNGSRVLAIRFTHWYNNAQRFSANIDRAMRYLDLIKNDFGDTSVAPYYLLMNGVDHLEAQEDLLPILDKMNQQLPENETIKQCSMQDYIDCVYQYINSHGVDPIHYTGELRNGGSNNLLQGTLSSRIHLKLLNTNAQNLLENALEPVYTLLLSHGMDNIYPQDYITFLWKLLMENHAHDSICGCSTDAVHAHMEDRYSRFFETAHQLLERGLHTLSAHISREGMKKEDFLLVVFNSSPMIYSGVTYATLQFPTDEIPEHFSITDSLGNDVQYVITDREKVDKLITSPINLPSIMEVEQIQIKLYLENVLPMSYTTLIVGTAQQNREAPEPHNDHVMENQYIRVTISENGQVDLIQKSNLKCYRDVLRFEDTEDAGHSYIYAPAQDSRTFFTQHLTPQISLSASDSLETAYCLTYNFQLPDGLDDSYQSRSGNLIDNPMIIRLSVLKGCPWLNVQVEFENNSKDHRLRALINTGIVTDFSYAYSPFDIIKRDRRDLLNGTGDGTQPNCGFMSLCDSDCGITVLNQGLYEYQHILEKDGVIALTLLRSNPYMTRGRDRRSARNGPYYQPGNLCLGRTCVKFALYPHKGDYIDANSPDMLKQFQNGLLTFFQGYDVKKFTGGRTDVQDSQVSELFYRKSPYEHVSLPKQMSMFKIKGNGVVLSSLKKAEDGNMIVLRLFNSLNSENTFGIDFNFHVQEVFRLNLAETCLENICLDEIMLKPKEILTIGVRL